MAIRADRVGDFLDGVRHRKKIIVTPEGVPLDIRIANKGERFAAFALDMLFMLIAILIISGIFVATLFANTNVLIGSTIFFFAAFVVRVLYFIHFELAWQGRTPGKKICGLRVINRQGGELSPSAVIARNLTREVEVFLPISLYFSLASRGWQGFALLGWVLVIVCLPFFNREHLRAGDLIAGTLVISIPKRVLLEDLAFVPQAERQTAQTSYVFTHQQLAIYGAFELQILEELLRRPRTPESERLLGEVCEKICRKIEWHEAIPPQNVRRFLNDFYTAERANLERGQLFGKTKEDKTSAVEKNGENK